MFKVKISKLLILGLFVAGTGSTSQGATNLNTSRSNVYKSLPDTSVVTASNEFVGSEKTLTLMTTPIHVDFVITQVCASKGQGGVRIEVEGMGTIAQIIGNESCQNFYPGLIVGKQKAIQCRREAVESANLVASGIHHSCRISGLKSDILL